MHYTIDYNGVRAKAFQAVEDIKDYLGIDKWDIVSPMMAKVKDRDQFGFYASIAGISGYPVQAWYELYHGSGSWYLEDATVENGWLTEAGGFVMEVKDV